jgi:hypothetical protein
MEIPIGSITVTIALATIAWQLVEYRDWIGATGTAAVYVVSYVEAWIVGATLNHSLKALRGRLNAQGVSTEEIDGLLAK